MNERVQHRDYQLRQQLHACQARTHLAIAGMNALQDALIRVLRDESIDVVVTLVGRLDEVRTILSGGH